MLQNIHLPTGLKLLLLITVLILAVSSCTTPKRKLIYMHKIEPNKVYPNNLVPETYLIQPNDHLYIVVMGDDPLNTAFLNLTTAVSGSAGSDLELVTYRVNKDGNISFPQLGEIPVEGKTVHEIQNVLQERISSYIENTAVFVQLVGRNITVLGEVLSPGTVRIYRNQLTIFEAIGAAGDMNDWADRRDVKLIRKSTDGTEIVSLDLTDPSILYSDHYYIYPNDVIYIQPKSKVFGFKTLGYFDFLTVGLSLITTTLVILTFMQTQ